VPLLEQSPAAPAVQARLAGAAGRRASPLRDLWRSRWAYLFIAPFFILFAVFFVYPILFSFWLSLHSTRGLGKAEFEGLGNFLLLLRDQFFWGSMLNAAILFFIYVPVMTALAVILAAILNAGFLRLQGLWRALIFLPHITSMVAAGYTFRLLLDRDSGYVNTALSLVGVSPIPWLDDAWWARISLGLLMIWAWLGYNTVIMLAGLQTIPRELSEAAKVDGADDVQALVRVTVPLLKPVIVFAVTLSIIGTFAMFAEPFVLTRGGPARATETPVMQIFSTTFEELKYGYAAAMAFVYFAVVVVVTIIQFGFVTRGEQD
jgi:lactose/L-arabinose transport system permease protein